MKNLLVLILIAWTAVSNAQELVRYSCFTDRKEVNKWMSYNARTFDDEGIILNKGQYHPLGIVQFGILSYYAFIDTGDSTYYHHVLNQEKYFKDSSKIHFLHEGKSIGLPYMYTYKEMKAPWYSGMTQGKALSFLLRYRALTGDEEITEIIQKIANMLFVPVSNKGTLSNTSEGYIWIEEYPNSKKSPQVLNGFINGLIGLKEYCDFFPEDTLAARLHGDFYQSMKLTLGKYDAQEWTNYSRRGSRCAPHYMQYEIFEMRQLFDMYGDSALYNQWQLWSYFGRDSKITHNDPTFSLPHYLPAVELELDSSLMTHIAKEEIDTAIYYDFKVESQTGLTRLKRKKKLSQLIIELDSVTRINYLEFGVQNPGEIKEFHYRISPEDPFEVMSPDRLLQTEERLVVDLQDEMAFQYLEVQLKHGKEFLLNSTFAADIAPFSTPFFYFYKVKGQEYAEGNYRYSIDNLGAQGISVFYRNSPTVNTLQHMTWSIVNMKSGASNELCLPKKEAYEFLIMYEPIHPHSSVGNFVLEPIR